VRVELETGRTHQIRVHLAHIGFPVVGDPLYAGRRGFPQAARRRWPPSFMPSGARRCTPRV